MRLNSLEISNFRVLKSVKLDFPDKVIAIVGKNGAGKSSIIEAISWALYGNQAARSSKDEIKSTFANDNENCEVKVQFLINEERFTVIRRLVGKSNRAEVELYRGDKSESVGVNETKSHVGQLLGLDWRGFLSSFLARQSELNALSDLVPSKRKDHIAGMLGIERLDKAIVLLKQDTKLYKETTAFLERTLSEKDTIDTFITELQEKLANIESQIRPQNEQFKRVQLELENAKKSFDLYSQKRIQFLEAESKLKAQKSTLEILHEQLERHHTEKVKLSDQQELLQKLLQEQERLKEVPEKFEHLKVLKTNKKYVSDLNSQLLSLSQRLDKNSQTITKLKDQLIVLEKQLESFPDNIEKNLQNQKLELEDKRSQYSSLKTEIERLEVDIAKLKNQRLNISTLKTESVCDRCHRPLGDDFESIKRHIDEEIQMLSSQLSDKTKFQQDVLRVGEELKKSLEKLERLYKEKILLNPEIESVKKELAKSQEFEKECKIKETEVSSKLKNLGDINFSEKEFETVTTQFEQFEQNRTNISRYKGQLERLPLLDSELEKLGTKIKLTQETIEIESLHIKSIGFSVSEFEILTETYNKSQQVFEESKNKLFEITKEKELTSVSLQEKLNQQAMFKKSEEEFEKNKTAHYYGEKLSSLFSLYRHDLIASIRPTLADISSRLFNEMTDNKYSLVELDEKYDLRVMDSGQFFGVERFSGGEKDLANLCLRLAISLSLTESAGLSRSFIILDEVFGSQDDERKNHILSALANLKNRFPQILLITHIEDIKDGVEQIIEVKQNDFGFSEVLVHGS